MIDPLQKAAECERALKTCTNETRKLILITLRELWVAVANDKRSGVGDWRVQAEKFETLHTSILASLQHAADRHRRDHCRPPPDWESFSH
jgi:hypothetical protein